MPTEQEIESSTPLWNSERPFLTGLFHRHTGAAHRLAEFSPSSNSIGRCSRELQELIVMDDLLWTLLGIEGRHVSIKAIGGKEYDVALDLDPSMDSSLQEFCKRLFPLSRYYILIHRFIESRSQFKYGLVNQAFASAIRSRLLDYQSMVAQLEHQFRLGRLSMQGLWFYCQPMMTSMQSLFTVVHKSSDKNLSGCAVLNLLQSQAKAMSGDNSVRSMLDKMTEYASNAYLGILERWIYEGVIDDPYGEFFIAEDKSLQKESLTYDYDAKYWRQRYSFKDGIPTFLSSISGKILTTGKYLNVLRECGHSVLAPNSGNTKLTSFGSNHQYLECIKKAYDFASNELLSLIMDKYKLVATLRSIKHYLLLDQGDFLVHFMDIARDELGKKCDDVSVDKLQPLLGLALRSTAAAADPLHEDVTCCVEKSSLLKTLPYSLKEIGMTAAYVDNDIEEPMNICGLETFCLGYRAQWPLSIVISRRALRKYQLIFRFLFHCKHVDRQLNAAWQLHQGVRAVDMRGTAIPRSSLLCRSMLKFINCLLHYLTFEVIEPNWHSMQISLQSAKSIDDVIHTHDVFLDKCLRQCLLLIPDLLYKVESLKTLCLQYVSATQWLVSSSIKDADVDQRKVKRRSVADVSVTHSILKFEKDFVTELRELGGILEKNSRAEPHLTHLSQCMLSGFA